MKVDWDAFECGKLSPLVGMEGLDIEMEGLDVRMELICARMEAPLAALEREMVVTV